MPDWSVFRATFSRSLADMSALFKSGGERRSTLQNWAKVADRRSAPVVERLRAGLFLRYRQATGVGETNVFQRDAKTWALFEHAVLPELRNFSFYDKSRDLIVSAPAVLAEGMFHIWTATELEQSENGPPTTIHVITGLAHYLCSAYEVTKVDRRKKRRRWFPL